MIIIGVDAETNGFKNEKDEYDEERSELCEIGACLFHVESKTVLAQFGKIYRIHNWGEEAAEVHQIPKELSDLMPYVPPQEEENPFKLISGNMARFVVAHNAPHDYPYFAKLWPDFLSIPWLCTQRDLPHNDKLRRPAYSKRLGHLCVDYGIQFSGWHRALVDAEACARIASFHDLEAAYEEKLKSKFRLVTYGEFIKDINKETMSQIPSVLEDDRRYRWNTNECPRAWSKDYLPEEFIEPDVRYIKEITGDRWKFEIEPMPPKTY